MDKSASKSRAGKARRIIGDVLIALVVLFTAWLSVVMIHRINTVVLKDTYRTIFRNELILCAVVLVFALDLRFLFFTALRPKAAKTVGWVLRCLVILLTAVIVFFFGKILVGSMINTAREAQSVVVLGMALEDGQPTKDLLLRLDTAQRYAERYPNATLILTGGNPDASGRTEALVMKELLTERGVPENRMVLEDQASSTRENFRNAAQLIDPAAPVVLVSSNYHMDRAVNMAGQAGFRNIMRLPAPSDPLRFGANIMWEVILEINEMKAPAR